jgi:hypothetical protein
MINELPKFRAENIVITSTIPEKHENVSKSLSELGYIYCEKHRVWHMQECSRCLSIKLNKSAIINNGLNFHRGDPNNGYLR